MKKKFLLALLSVIFVFLSSAKEESDLHELWDTLLNKHIQNGKVDYLGFAADIKLLDQYLEKIGKVNISKYSKEDRLAFWLNSYNAFTIKLILNHYPIKSIKKISNPWGQQIWKAAGKILSLDNIEHRILRKEFNEPRIHFAIVCASIGCPDLKNLAYRGEVIKGQLEKVTQYFFSSKKHFFLEEKRGGALIHISKIFSWFGDDFGKTKKERIDFIMSYLKDGMVKKIIDAKYVKFKYIDYDWNLNDLKSEKN